MLTLRVYISRDNTGETARGCGTPEILVARSSKVGLVKSCCLVMYEKIIVLKKKNSYRLTSSARNGDFFFLFTWPHNPPASTKSSN